MHRFQNAPFRECAVSGTDSASTPPARVPGGGAGGAGGPRPRTGMGKLRSHSFGSRAPATEVGRTPCAGTGRRRRRRRPCLPRLASESCQGHPRRPGRLPLGRLPLGRLTDWAGPHSHWSVSTAPDLTEPAPSGPPSGPAPSGPAHSPGRLPLSLGRFQLAHWAGSGRAGSHPRNGGDPAPQQAPRGPAAPARLDCSGSGDPAAPRLICNFNTKQTASDSTASRVPHPSLRTRLGCCSGSGDPAGPPLGPLLALSGRFSRLGGHPPCLEITEYAAHRYIHRYCRGQAARGASTALRTGPGPGRPRIRPVAMAQ